MDLTSTKDDRGRRIIEMRVNVDAPVRTVWDLVANTERLDNELFDLPLLIDVELAPDVGRGLQHTVIGDFAFEELPWVFEAPLRYRMVRRFPSGPIERFEQHCELEAQGTRTTASYRAVMTARSGPVAWAAEKVATRQRIREFELLGAMLEAVTPDTASTFALHAEYRAVRARAAAFEPALVATHDPALAAALCEHIARGPNDEVAHIYPYMLADRWGAARDSVLALCLDAVGAGLLQMRWETICPSCRAAVHRVKALDDVPDQHTCSACRLDVVASRTSNVAASFTPVFAVRKAMDGFHCLGSPRRTSHWLAQLLLAPGEQYDVTTTLGAGRYLVQSPGITARTVLDVGEAGDEDVRVTIERAVADRPAVLPGATPPLRAGKVVLRLKNDDETMRRVQLVHEGFADLAATAAHVVETAAWRRLRDNSQS